MSTTVPRPALVLRYYGDLSEAQVAAAMGISKALSKRTPRGQCHRYAPSWNGTTTLFGYACVLVRGDQALADDLVQATFEAAGRAWCTVGCLTEDQRSGWLRATLANIAVSGFRREAAFRDRLQRIEARYRKTEADTPAQAFSSIALERCRQIIQGMPAGPAARGGGAALAAGHERRRDRRCARHRGEDGERAPAPSPPQADQRSSIEACGTCGSVRQPTAGWADAGGPGS
jgi:DNA-directed RNA polymerase specialized sigma24 family protein